MNYINYHKHSHYTNVRIADSTVTMEDYAKRAVELNQTVISSCEHGFSGNQFECIKLAKKYNLKPLISAEAYWVKDRFEKDKTNCHIFIAALNENGRQTLNDILSEANLTGFYMQPRIDIPLILSLPKDDVIVTTSCLAGWKYEDCVEIFKQFKEHFGDNFYLEVQYHLTDSQIELNKLILKLSKELNVKIIAGCDSHYIYPTQSQTRIDFLLSKGINYPEEEGWFLDYPDGDTVYKRFAKQCVLTHDEIIEAINNTLVFDNVEEYSSPIFNNELKMPSLFPTLTQEEKNEVYKNLVLKGWENYKENIPKEKWALYKNEINKEMQVVIDTNMADYFICNYYIIKKGIENGGNLTMSGRGSGVSFITNKLLGFTEVDRISAKVHMYPERFMSTTRILNTGSIPDIDFNVAPVEPFAKAQKEVLGEEHSYPMIAFGTMKKSAAWKLYAKSQGIPFEIANAVSEQIKKYEVALKHATEDTKEEIDINDYISREFKDIYEKSKKYLGLITSWSIAPSAYLLYSGNIRKEIGLVKIKDNICCLVDGHIGEEYRFLKNDLLKVSVVDLIYRTCRRIGLNNPPSVNELLNICTKDNKVWDIYKNGCTLGINQCEQTGTSARVSKFNPTNISELSAFVAAIRPGFKSMYSKFEKKEHFEYGIKSFDALIQTEEMPNSYVLYQEQEMAVLNFAGIPMDECYTAIKNIAKKRVDKVLAYKETFITGFSREIINKEDKTIEDATDFANKLWQIIEDSASYSFNASHSYCVAIDSLYCAWLKSHYPLEFYETLLIINAEKGDKDKMNAIKSEAENYFKINFPPFKYGQDNRSIKANNERNEITNSLESLKGFGNEVGSILYDCYNLNHKTFIEVLKYLYKNGIKTSKVKPLILIDYFSQFGNINQLIKIQDFYEFLKQGEGKIVKKTPLLPTEYIQVFDSICNSSPSSYKVGEHINECFTIFENLIISQDVKPPTIQEMIKWDMKILGYADVVTNKEIDLKRLLITEISPLISQNGKTWAYRVGTRSLGSGKKARVTIKENIYNQSPIISGDVIYAKELYKNDKGYWYLMKYIKE